MREVDRVSDAMGTNRVAWISLSRMALKGILDKEIRAA